MKRLVLAILVVLSLAVAANAQTFRGAINGTVTDPSGAVVPNAAVKATENNTGIDHNTVTTSDGVFAFQDIPLGFYKVSVTASGFPVYTVDKVEVTAGTIYTLPVKLSLQQQATTVEVSAAALSLDTTTQTQNMTITSDAVQDIPLNGRDFTQLIATAPGYGGYSVGGFGSLNGSRANGMNWQIDGVDNNDFWHNIPAVNQGGVSGIAGVVLPIDAIDEFSAQSQSSAETGRNPGGTINLALKSGGNDLHGSVYYYNRNEFFGAHSPFFAAAPGKRAPPLRNENYGATVGGPIVKNKAFFFLGYEKQDYLIGLSGKATEPSAAWQTAAQAALAKYNVTPNPLSTTLLANLWPASVLNDPAVNAVGAAENNFFSSSPSTGFSYNGLGKLDYNFNDKHHLSFHMFSGEGNQIQPTGGSAALGSASSNLKYYFEEAPIHVQNYSLVLNSVLTVHLTNQVLFGVNYFNQVFHDFNNSFNTKNLGLFLSPSATSNGQATGTPLPGAPNIIIVPYPGSSGAGFEQVGITPPEGRNDIVGHLTDIVSYTVGKHEIRFGGEFRQGRVDEFYFRHGLGSFAFDGTAGPWRNDATINGDTKALADFLAGDVSACNAAKNSVSSSCGASIAVGNQERHVTVNAINFFGQDAWKFSNRLTLTFGLRYEYFGPIHSTDGTLASFIPGKGVVVGQIYPPDKNNFAPRIGFSYQPTSKGDLVVRGGVGVFYAQTNMNPFLDYRPPSGADGLEDNPAGPAAVSLYTLNNGFTWQPNVQVFPAVSTCPSGVGCANAPFDVFGVSQNFRTPYTYNYNLQVEKSLSSAAVLQVGYVGSETRKQSVMLDINQHGQFAAQYPSFGHINQLNSIANSNYNALQTTFRVRAWRGLSAQFAYTWAHALDTDTDYRHVLPLDSANLKQEYGNSDFDTRHNFTSFFTYDVPKAPWAHGWSERLVNGWQVSTLISLHSGQPFGGSPRPSLNQVLADPFAGVSHAFKKSGVTWINPAAFVSAGTDPVTGIALPGNVTRNKYYGPNFKDVDLSVIKNIPIRERLKVQLRAEMYNLFNRVNLASGTGTVNGSGIVNDTIGDFNGAPGIGPGEAFNMQLAAKIIF
jgi:Carboxypeptidase regulatory-like domain/TonB dependent receptor